MSWVRASLVPRQTSASKVFRTKRHEFGLCANKLWQKFEVASTIGEVPILQEILSLNWVTWKNSKYEKYIACGDERVKNFRRNVKPTKRVKLISESFLTGFYHFLYLKFCLVFNTFHCNIYISKFWRKKNRDKLLRYYINNRSWVDYFPKFWTSIIM